jgi:hypothetical protein
MTRSASVPGSPPIVPTRLARRDVPLGLAVGAGFNLATFYVANPYVVLVAGLFVAVAATTIWGQRVLAWVAMASVMAANPAFNVSVSLNLLFAMVFTALNWRYLTKLPRWAIVFCFLAGASVLASVPTWQNGATLENGITQGAAVINYLVGPFVLLPMVYFRLDQEPSSSRLVELLLYGLIVPTTATLSVAHRFGVPTSLSPINALQDYGVNESVFHLVNVDVMLSRTQVGIVLASLICAAFAILIAPVTRVTRVVAGCCLFACLALMSVTASVGSGLAGVMGLVGVLLLSRGKFSIPRMVGVLAVTGIVVALVWLVVPGPVQEYVASRYNERFGGGFIDGFDRLEIWRSAIQQLASNPGGVGWALWVTGIGTYPHNDYLTYGIAYGIGCGLVYLLFPLWLLNDLVSRSLADRDPGRSAIAQAGVGVALVLLTNSLSDHLTANRWYFNVVWSIVWFAWCSLGARKAGPGIARRWRRQGTQ